MSMTKTLAEQAQIPEDSPVIRARLLDRGHVRGRGGLAVWGYRAAASLASLMMCFCTWYIAYQTIKDRTSVESTVDTLMKRGQTQSDLFALQLQNHMNSTVLVSAGMIMGFAFGFLGFALFMMGIQGSVDVTASQGDSKASFTRLSPGLFVMLCASSLIGFCLYNKPESTGYSIVGERAPSAAAVGKTPDLSARPAR